MPPPIFRLLINDRYDAGIILAYVLKETPFVAIMTPALLLRLGDGYEALDGSKRFIKPTLTG